MPWAETSAMQERIRFIADYNSGLDSMTEICARFGVSRQTGYKWVRRYREEGAVGLEASLTSFARSTGLILGPTLRPREARLNDLRSPKSLGRGDLPGLPDNSYGKLRGGSPERSPRTPLRS